MSGQLPIPEDPDLRRAVGTLDPFSRSVLEAFGRKALPQLGSLNGEAGARDLFAQAASQMLRHQGLPTADLDGSLRDFLHTYGEELFTLSGRLVQRYRDTGGPVDSFLDGIFLPAGNARPSEPLSEVICPGCFQRLSGLMRYCVFCGTDLAASHRQAAPPEAPIQLLSSDELADDIWSMPKCPRCGRLNPPDPGPGGHCAGCAPKIDPILGKKPRRKSPFRPQGPDVATGAGPAPASNETEPGGGDTGLELPAPPSGSAPLMPPSPEPGTEAPEPEVRLAPERGRHTCLACNTEQARREGTRFCIQCGLPIEQQCPYCRKGIPTRFGSDLTCPECSRRLRACQECLRFYPPEDLTCINAYCPHRGVPWTVSGGTGVWPHAGGDGARSGWVSSADPERLVPLWRWTAPEETELLSPVNAVGVVFCANRKGEVWSFFEPGAQRPDAVPGGYERAPLLIHNLHLDAAVTSLVARDGSLCLGLQGARMVRLDIASQRVTPLETVPATPEHLLSLPKGVVGAGGRHAWLLDPDDRVRHRVSLEDCQSAAPLSPVAIGQDDVVIGWNVRRGGAVEFECRILRDGGQNWEPLTQFPEEVDFVLGGEQLTCCSRQTIRRVGPDGVVRSFSLRAPLQVQPGLDHSNQRLIFCLTDGSIRTCRYDGQGLAFRHQAAGTVSGPPLLLGRTVLYGVTESHLYLGQEIASPLLNGPVTPHLSCANGRVFATTEKGGLYAFRLEP